MRALAIPVVLAALALAVVAVVWILNRADRARQDRKARARHEAFLADLLKQAITHSGANVFADYFADEIRTHLSLPEKEITK